MLYIVIFWILLFLCMEPFLNTKNTNVIVLSSVLAFSIASLLTYGLMYLADKYNFHYAPLF